MSTPDSVRAEPSSPRASRWLDGLCLCVAGAVAFVLALGAFDEPDLYWHLAVGRHVAEHGAVPTTNLWSYTAPEHPFAATSWLYGLIIFLVERRAGLEGVHLLTASFVGAAFALVYATARRWGAGPGWALAASVAGAFASEFRFPPRPHTASYFFLACTAWLLVYARRSRRRWPLFVIPLLLALWSNFHAGAVFGAGLVGCFVLAEALPVLRARGGPGARAVLPGLVALGVTSLLALLANPSGLETARYVVFHLGQVDDVVPLREFEVPALREQAPFWLLLGVCLALLALELRQRRADLYAALATLAFALLAARVLRVVPKFLIVALPFAAASAEHALRRVLHREGAAPGGRARGAGLLAPLLLLGAVLVALPDPLSHFLERIQLGPLPYRFPERMARYAEQHHISGRCFASWDVSGLVEWRLPDSPVFIDPRLRAYPPELFRELARSDEDPAVFDALMDRYGTEWAFRGHSFYLLSGVGRFRPEEWAVVYWDEAGQLLLRRSVPRFRELIARDEYRSFLPETKPLEAFQQLRGEERQRWVEEMRRAASSAQGGLNVDVGLCLELARQKDLEAAAGHCDAAIAGVADRERFYPRGQGANRVKVALALTHLGEQARAQGLPDFARGALEQALAMAPDTAPALAGLGWLEVDTAPERARELFEQALERQPGLTSAQQGLQRLGARP